MKKTLIKIWDWIVLTLLGALFIAMCLYVVGVVLAYFFMGF